MALILAQISPSRLNAWNRSFIDGLGIGLTKFQEHLTCDVAPVEYLRLDSLEYARSKRCHLFDEFGSQAVILKFLQSLKISLLLCRSNHGVAIAVLEEIENKSSDSVLLLNVVGGPFLLFKCVFKILLRIDLVPILIQQSQGEISNDPQE